MTALAIQACARAGILSPEDYIDYLDALFDTIRAEAKAEALRWAADKAVDWFLDAVEDPGLMTTDDLRAAITGEPPAGDARG